MSSLSYFEATDQGKVRPNNQDCIAVLQEEGVVLLADGMGGHAGGEVASRMAVETMRHYLSRGMTDTSAALPELLRAAIVEADRGIAAAAQYGEGLRGMGTTIVAAVCRPDAVVIAHVGDSRAYLYSRESLTLLTQDHTLVQQMVLSGEISLRQAAQHPMRNVLTRSLGNKNNAAPDVEIHPWAAGDILLVCSDGLNRMLSDKEMEKQIRRSGADLRQTGTQLIRKALQQGGHDNVSLVLVRKS